MSFRACCFTINNPQTSEIETLKRNIQTFCKYGIFQIERGANGTKHVQGFAYGDKRRVSGWRSIISNRAHIESARGSPAQNKQYCSKEETREPGTEPWEFGTIPSQGARNDISSAVEFIRQGASLQDVALEHPEVFVKYQRGILAAQTVFLGRRTWKTEVFWWFGQVCQIFF